MRLRNKLLLSLFLGVLVWMVFSWPLPRYVADGIPCSSENVEKDGVRTMIAGDHLQYLYHWWLAGDMLAGNTRCFRNVYEFNTGDDDDRFYPSLFWFPFSALYVLFGGWINRALAYNLVGVVSIWLTFFATWILARRYCDRDSIAAGAALVSITHPYRWYSLLGGSPVGPAMLWIPLICLGIDVALRDRKVAGGIIAGASLFFAALTDAHVFFFGAMFAPCWVLIAFVKSEWVTGRSVKPWLRAAIALSPVLVFAALTLWYMDFRNSHVLAGTAVRAGRGWAEISLNSPRGWKYLFDLGAVRGFNNHVYIGYAVMLVSVLGLVAALRNIRQNPGRVVRLLLVTLLLGALATVIFMLAYGPYGPSKGNVLVAFRHRVPPYRMIRQPTKVVCLVPTLFAVLSAATLGELLSESRKRFRAALPLSIAFALLAAAEYGRRVWPSVCLLEPEPATYRAVAEESRAEGKVARALAIPLWPGEAAWSSLYQYDATFSHVRMLNGYSPAVPPGYFENVFRRFESVNKGVLTDDQLAALEEIGIRHLVLHENAFPEKVSPLPAGFTLKQLLNHPRLELMEQADDTWAFRVLPGPRDVEHLFTGWTVFFPSRRWELERCTNGDGTVVEDPTALLDACRLLDNPGNEVTTTMRPRAPYMVDTEGLGWLVRARGTAEIDAIVTVGDRTNRIQRLSLKGDEWAWTHVETGRFEEYAPLTLRFRLVSGEVLLDSAILTKGGIPDVPVGGSLVIPAACCHRGGYTDPDDSSVVLRATHEGSEPLYGRNLVLPAGRYRFGFLFSAGTPIGTRLGHVELSVPGHQPMQVDVITGSPATTDFTIPDAVPIGLQFHFERTADMKVYRITFTRKAEK